MQWGEVGENGTWHTTTEGIRPDEEPVLKTGGGMVRLGVRVPRLPPQISDFGFQIPDLSLPERDYRGSNLKSEI